MISQEAVKVGLEERRQLPLTVQLEMINSGGCSDLVQVGVWAIDRV